MNQKSAGGDADSLLSSIYAPVYKKFVAGPVDGVLWVKEGCYDGIEEERQDYVSRRRERKERCKFCAVD